MEASRRMRYGEKLVNINIISPKQLEEALEEQKKTLEKIGEILLKHRFFDEEIYLKTLSEHLGISYTHLKLEDIEEEVLKNFPVEIIKKYRVIPIKRSKYKIYVAVYMQTNLLTLDEIQMEMNTIIEPVLILS